MTTYRITVQNSLRRVVLRAQFFGVYAALRAFRYYAKHYHGTITMENTR